MSETSEEPTETVLVSDAPERGRFEISVDGRTVGLAEYVDAAAAGGTERTFPHTEIDAAYGGRGLSTILIQNALDATRVQGYQVVPSCSAVHRFIAKHPEYVDLVSAERRTELGL